MRVNKSTKGLHNLTQTVRSPLYRKHMGRACRNGSFNFDSDPPIVRASAFIRKGIEYYFECIFQIIETPVLALWHHLYPSCDCIDEYFLGVSNFRFHSTTVLVKLRWCYFTFVERSRALKFWNFARVSNLNIFYLLLHLVTFKIAFTQPLIFVPFFFVLASRVTFIIYTADNVRGNVPGLFSYWKNILPYGIAYTLETQACGNARV